MEKKLPTINEEHFEKSGVEILSGIFLAEYKLNNMNMERIVVVDAAIQTILKITRLSLEAQEEAVFKLADRTADWLDLDEAEQIAKIKTVLTQETVLAYLQEVGIVRDKVDTVDLGIDEEGSIVVYAYYTNLSRAQRRKMERALSEGDKNALVDAFNILSGEENKLIDLAAKKIEKLKQEGKNFRGKELK